MPENQAREIPAEHHVWAPGEDVQSEPFDRFGNAFLRELRWREPPRERGRISFALFIAIIFHIVVIVLLKFEMRPRLVAPPEEHAPESAIQVTLYETPQTVSAAAPPPPAIELPPVRTRETSPRRMRVEPRHPNSITATIGETQPAAPRLYGRQGQVLLPPSSSVAATSDYAVPQPQEPGLMKHTTPLPYHATQFDKDWAPDGESIGARAFRRAAQATTKEKTIRLPGGLKIKCAVSPLVLAAGCGLEPPPPPPKNDDDIRLSMPPAQSLTGKKVTVPAAPSSAKPVARPAPAHSGS
ncbi:MAG: hypothetical protein ABI132_11865 [Rhodanobacteraceae bacterium]